MWFSVLFLFMLIFSYAEFKQADHQKTSPQKNEIYRSYNFVDTFNDYRKTSSKSVSYVNGNSCTVEVKERKNCLPLDEVNQKMCASVGCCWDENFNVSNWPIPPCYFTPQITRYKIVSMNRTTFGILASLTLISSSGLPADIPTVNVRISFCGENMLRLRITDAKTKRYEVPLLLSVESCTSQPKHTLYNVNLLLNGTLVVKRGTSNRTIFSTDFSSLLFADQVLQLSSTLPSHKIYGLGDHMGPLLKSTNWTMYTFFNRDEIPKRNKNLYSSFPYYLALDEDGVAHGVYLFNSNAMDVVLQPEPSVTFRTIGGILDFFIFLGPSPNAVVQQFTKLVGYPALPPFWSLGFHLSSLGYDTLNKTIEVWNRTRMAGIPLSTMWNDITYMKNYNDFTFDDENFKDLPEFVDYLHNMGMHYVLITDPGISSAEKPGTYPPFDDGLALDIFIKNASGQILETKVWNKVSSVFPDFTHPLTADYWKKQLLNLHNIIKYDGIWLDMNEPTNFLNGSFHGCPKDSLLEYPPYTPGNDALMTKTICMTSRHNSSVHYNIHNIYGTLETKTTYKAMADIRHKRPFILTRAGFPGIGKYAAMWNGDVESSWDHMRQSIPSMLSYSMAGIPNIGSDICGFNGNTTEELCARWFALGAFYPFCRNHNSDDTIEQDPVALGENVTLAAWASLTHRYYLLPYLYTLMYFSHINGDTVARPLFFEFPTDVNTHHIDSQFMWGPALMILPVLEPDTQNFSAYLPSDIWFNGHGMKLVSHGENFTFPTSFPQVIYFVRGGYVVPTQIQTSRTNSPFVLMVALDCVGKASGSLYWDDGDSLDADDKNMYNLIYFNVSNNRLTSTLYHVGYMTDMALVSIGILGVSQKPETVSVNGQSLPKFDYRSSDGLLVIENLSESLLKPLIVEWQRAAN